MNKDIEQAIDNLRRAAGKYSKPERYYKGKHDLSFATEKFQNTFGSLFREFAMNLCPAIVDAVKDKLRVTGFSADGVSSPRVNKGKPEVNGAEGNASATNTRVALTHVRATDMMRATDMEAIDAATRRIWQRNRMGQVAGEIHKEALRCGDAYAVVWFDPRGEVTIYPQRAASITVSYDEDTPGRIAWAAKYWRTTDKRVRLNLFYPDRIEKYVSKEMSDGMLPEAKGFVPLGTRAPSPASVPKDAYTRGEYSSFGKAGAVTPEEPAWQAGAPAFQSNPYGIVPVFHFANNADIGAFGQSELEAAIPIQDGLNKSILDMLVAMEFSAFRQRWIAGLEVETDRETGKQLLPFQPGVERLWIAAQSDTKFGDFNTSDLKQFLGVKDGFRIDMASVTGTPLHYFLQSSGDFPSGESLKKAETRFLAKVRDRQESLGQVWADLMAFALRIEGSVHDVRLITEWEDPAPMSEREVLENILLKKQIGLPVEQALIEAGYGAADAKRMVSGLAVE